MAGNSLNEMFVQELRDIYDGEQQIVKALPKIASKAADEKLRQALEQHLEETREQVERLKQIFQHLGETATRKPCKGIQGVLAEGEQVLEELSEGSVRDAAIIAGAQKVEHYEIATYGTLIAWAKELGHDDAVDLLEETIDEEGDADQTLTDIAEGGLIASGVNETAAQR